MKRLMNIVKPLESLCECDHTIALHTEKGCEGPYCDCRNRAVEVMAEVSLNTLCDVVRRLEVLESPK